MKLIFKHIFRSVRKYPIQPLLIILTVSLSMALSVAAFSFCQKLNEDAIESSNAKKEIGDILITTRADSDTRILFAEDVESLVGEKADVTGEFSLVGFSDITNAHGDTLRSEVSVSAADLEDIDRFYEFEYCSYGSFNTQNIDRSAIVSKSFADKAGLKVGDSLEISFLQEEMRYTVQAVAQDSGILSEKDMIISFSGLEEMISRKIPSISALGDSFAPCSRVMVKANSGTSKQQLVDLLENSDSAADKRVVLSEDRAKIDFWILLQVVGVYTFLILILLLAAFLIGTSLTFLNKKRSEELSLFSLVGANARQINTWRVFECSIYALFGIMVGAFLAIPITTVAGGFYGWDLKVSAIGLVSGCVMSVALMACCVLRHLLSRPFSTRKKTSPTGRGVLYLTALIILLCLIFVLPTRYRYIPCIVAVLVLTWIIFLGAPLLLRRIALLIEKRSEKKAVPAPTVVLASKNLGRQFAYSFLCALLSVMISILGVISVCQGIMSSQAELLGKGITADTVAYGLSENAQRRLVQEEGVDRCLRLFYSDAQLSDASTAIAISTDGDTSHFIDKEVLPKKMPRGNEIAISAGIAELSQAGEGDCIDVNIGGAEYTLVVSEILKVNSNMFYFDSEFFKMRKNIVFVAFDTGADDLLTKERVFSIIEADGAFASDSYENDSEIFYRKMKGHSDLLYYTMLASMILGGVGALNILLQANAERNLEKTRFIECGMEKRVFRRMRTYELIVLFATALSIALIAGAVMCVLVDAAIGSFGMVLFTF